MFKKISLFIFFITVTTIATAQVYEPAFIISIYGDTIRCQIKHIRFISNKTEFRYKKSLEDKKDLFINAKDVLWIVTPKDTFECLTTDKGLYKGQISAYKLLANGCLRLYEQEFFTKIGGEGAASFFIKKEGMLLQEISSMDYKKYFLLYAADYPDIKTRVEKLAYKEEELRLFVKEYNDWYQKKKTE